MIYGLYLSAQGAEAQALRQSVLANNLANAQTTGFKRDVPVFRAHAPYDLTNQQPHRAPDTFNDQTGGVELAATVTDFSQGPLRVTNAPFDLAVLGPGFLAVQSGDESLLTRDGQLTINTEGVLVTSPGGLPVLDVDARPIVLPPEVQDFTVAADGVATGRLPSGAPVPLGQLAIVEPASNTALTKRGQNLFSADGETQPAVAAQLRQGVLEESGTDPVTSMVDLIETSRVFEMNMNMMQYQDQMLGQFLQSLPRR